ncbi:sugar 3,4-ketoisomerase [Daejeonella oryzae]|uniref:sugar 3,4-ketoisomerase n=1 Tax=Daejeonella oryzae TaxID=1122943 RepID=UPI00041E9161|nr:FdtA/QdtA family cupin domain-containing protein [Daejeonella oryzae]
MTLQDVKIIDLPKILDPRGNLSFIEENKHVPFNIERTYWIYDVPGGEIRGGHAYKENCEFIIALSGSFDVVLHDGINEQKYSLNRSYYGLYVPNMLWRSVENFSTNSLALVLSSTIYDEKDYLRDFENFSQLKKEGVKKS